VRITRCLVLGLALAALPAPAAAQDDTPGVSIRPFALGTVESFTAVDTFTAVFGRSYQPFFGGGVQVVVDDTDVLELSASRFRQTGQRAFISGGQSFRLGIPLTAEITAFEATVGYRFRLSPRLRPYVAGGAGLYMYKESSDFSDPTAAPPGTAVDVDTRHVGFILNGGAEFRLHRWVGIGADVQYTHVTGILGTGGVSQQAGENNLGGVAARAKLIVGR
jgi:opacity protein-like surface antigen